MYVRPDNKPPMTAQFSRRVTILSGVAIVGFLVIFFRLWALEVLSSAQYVERARNNQVREIVRQAPRGEIRDRTGKVLVDNRTALDLQVRPDRLPENEVRRRRVLRRIAELADMKLPRVEREVNAGEVAPSNPVTLRRDVADEVIFFLQENQEEFPGVSVKPVFVRRYTQGSLAAHLFGHVREVSAEQLTQSRYQGLSSGEEVGQAGLELTYDSLLRGQSGATRLQVDALGRPAGRRLANREPRTGNNLQLTLDVGIQRAGEKALASFGLPGAFVAMDVNSGGILGMGSYPTFDPAVYTEVPLRQKQLDLLTSEELESPLSNRAIQGLYPSGSTFKLITATAALEEGLVEPSTQIFDNGFIQVGATQFSNAGDPRPAYGPINLIRALQVSSDVFFYTMGINAEQKGGDLIQGWAEDFGIGEATGIDLPAEVEGNVPSAAWRNQLYQDGVFNRPWTTGDNINFSVGQGDLQTNPLQLAVVAAAIANGGDIVQPHLADVAKDPIGQTLQEIAPPPRRHIEISPSTRLAIMEGMRLAAMEPSGTSFETFGRFPVTIAGKTGTAEKGFYDNGVPVPDQGWYVALAPAEDPEIVVAFTIERGGFGAASAAPATAQVLAKYFNLRQRDIRPVVDPTKVDPVEEAPADGSSGDGAAPDSGGGGGGGGGAKAPTGATGAGN
jgi:penicillin-binding protein 2